MCFRVVRYSCFWILFFVVPFLVLGLSLNVYAAGSTSIDTDRTLTDSYEEQSYYLNKEDITVTLASKASLTFTTGTVGLRALYSDKEGTSIISAGDNQLRCNHRISLWCQCISGRQFNSNTNLRYSG